MSREFLRVWAWPAAVAALSVTGLASALVCDGWGDRWSWLALGVPVAIGTWCVLPRPRGTKLPPR